MPKKPVYLGIHASGKSFKCVLGYASGSLEWGFEIPTSNPLDTFDRLEAKTRDQLDDRLSLRAIGIASFGPLNLDKKSNRFGRLLRTPKAGWQNTEISTELSKRFEVPVFIETDVNAGVLAEKAWGAAREHTNCVYVAIGYGIGAGILVNGEIVKGQGHTEAGHVPVARLESDLKNFHSVCPFHSDCLEGWASISAIEARWGVPFSRLSNDHPAWEVEANYLAQFCRTLTYIVRPDRILLGGELMSDDDLIVKTRNCFLAITGGYAVEHNKDVESYIGRPALGTDASVLGGLWLAIHRS